MEKNKIGEGKKRGKRESSTGDHNDNDANKDERGPFVMASLTTQCENYDLQR